MQSNRAIHSASVPPQSDVVVGGPAGCTAATLLARKGWAVTLLEKDRHPRFHIGESLLPRNLPILQRLGLLEAIERIGVRKVGADFPAPGPEGYNVLRFERALDPSCARAFQVRREEFDALLFDNAAANGVNALQGQRVTALGALPEQVRGHLFRRRQARALFSDGTTAQETR